MDFLKDTIVSIFAYSDLESVLRSWHKNDYSCTTQISIDELAHRLYERNIRSYSLNQMHAIAKTVCSLWMTNKTHAQQIHCSCAPTIFNIPLHFSGEILSIDGERKIRCGFEHVLRWHELTTELGEDWIVEAYHAASDLYHGFDESSSFNWKPIIPVDSKSVNDFFDGNYFTDIHHHLQGSSLNFDLNWLSLMNYANKLRWDKLFKENPLTDNQINIQSLAYKAACIRLYLWSCYHGKTRRITGREIKDVLSCRDDKVEISSANTLLSRLDEIRPLSYKFYTYGDNGSVDYTTSPVFVDYAITKDCLSVVNRKSSDFIYSVLSGERALMYTLFRDIYNHKFGIESNATLFYAYLLIKNRIRRYLVQVNDGIGFGNFDEYEQRKTLFIYKKSIFPILIDQLAVATSLAKNPKNRYLETRIAPNGSESVAAKIAKVDKNVLNPVFVDPNSSMKWRYDFVAHFIKTKPTECEVANPLQCRNYTCRQEVKEAAHKISEYMLAKVPGRKRLVGIDAANSEMNCRPEVFAQAYRYLRSTPVEVYDKQMGKLRSESLGVTYHVGEDNYDVVDGLRALDELTRFMEYRSGDRLGHCLVLGANVEDYYTKRHFTLMMPRIVLLDNVVWLLYQLDRNRYSCSSLKSYLMVLYEELFRAIYEQCSLPWYVTYYASWLLRGDNPELYRKNRLQSYGRSVKRWDRYAYTKGLKYSLARLNSEARRLNRKYHFDAKAKINGDVSSVVKIPTELRDDWVSAIDHIRKVYLHKIEEMGLCIESNPTSNRKIGDFNRYDEHPAMCFCHYDGYEMDDVYQISTSINTDDQGVFSTSLEREYALIALALKKKKKSKLDKILCWLNELRIYGGKQAFIHGEDKPLLETSREDA